MSPTYTSFGPAGASASTSVTSRWKSVTPTVSPLFGSSTKTREVSPESLTVAITEPRSASPLDSKIRSSRRLNTCVRRRSSAVGVSGRGGWYDDPAEEHADQHQPVDHRPASRSSSSARAGRSPHVEVRVSYSSRALRLRLGASADRTHSVFRGVCLLSTNSTTSTR